MKEIYIVLSYTGSWLAKLIKLYTKKQFSHVSIALDKELEDMYSFGRIHAYNPIVGGFVKEGINISTFKRFKNTTASIYKLNVTDEQYEIIKNKIYGMYAQKEVYKFNIIGLVLVAFNKKYIRKNTYYCAEFLKYVLEEAKVEVTPVSNIPTPDQFKSMNGLELVYTGYLREYSYEN